MPSSRDIIKGAGDAFTALQANEAALEESRKSLLNLWDRASVPKLATSEVLVKNTVLRRLSHKANELSTLVGNNENDSTSTLVNKVRRSENRDATELWHLLELMEAKDSAVATKKAEQWYGADNTESRLILAVMHDIATQTGPTVKNLHAFLAYVKEHKYSKLYNLVKALKEEGK